MSLSKTSSNEGEAATAAALVLKNKRVRRAAAGAIIGTSLEYYEFYIYASASALVFGHVFFPQQDPFVGTLLALATYALSYFIRPVAAMVLGHFGDRIGRRALMFFTLTLMGGATFLIGCLPTYEMIGVWAPILLVLLRLGQGISVAAEQASSSTLTFEHSPEGRRGLFTSFTPAGTAGGLLLGSAVFGAVSMMPREDLLSWGWRIPFWASLIVVVVGIIVRRKLEEPELFREEVKDAAVRPRRSSVAIIFTTYRRTTIRICIVGLFSVLFSIPPIFGLAFATSPAIGVPSGTMLWIYVAANAIALFLYPVYGSLSDRIGRKKVFIFGVVGGALMLFPYFAAVTSGNVLLILLATVVFTCVFASACNAVYPALFAESFPVEARLTGVAFGLQMATALTGLMPTVGWFLVGKEGTNWLPVALITLGLCALSSTAAALGKDSHRVRLEDLGRSGAESTRS